MLFHRYGCHHCGKRFGQVIADHQPPNKTVFGAFTVQRGGASPALTLASLARAQAARPRRLRQRRRRGR